MRLQDLALRLRGATSGEQIIRTAAAASGAITLPAGTTDFSGTGGTSQVIKQTTAGGAFTVGQVAATEVSGLAGLTANAVIVGGGAGAAPVASTATVDGSGNLTVTGLVGTATNNNAAAGNVGEYIVSNVTTPQNLTASIGINLTTISLTAGDWDVSGAVLFTPAATTPISRTYVTVSTISGDLGQANFATNSFSTHHINYPAGTINLTEVTPLLRLSLNATTTVYLVIYCGFTVSTCTAIGILRARRMR